MRAVVVEDDPPVAAGLRMQLEAMGHEVRAMAASAGRALAEIERDRPDSITCDSVVHSEGSDEFLGGAHGGPCTRGGPAYRG